MATVEHVVADAGAFIRSAPLFEIGQDIVTIRDVVSEIRDKATRQRLQVLPYELKFREPSTESIRFVTEFSKKTGDYRNLSAVDIRVLALTYQLEKEHCGTEHIKTLPDSNITWQTSRKHLDNPTEIAGFYLKSEKSTPSQSRTTSECSSHVGNLDMKTGISELSVTNEDKAEVISNETSPLDREHLEETNPPNSVNEIGTVDSTNKVNFEKSLDSADTRECTENECDRTPGELNQKESESVKDNAASLEINSLDVNEQQRHQTEDIGEGRGMIGCMGDGDVLPKNCIMNEDGDSESDESDDDEDEEDDEEGWITPGNINQMRARMGDKNMEKAQVKVGCLTTDFAMQNVLIQMGLNVISVDGMLIKRAKSYVLRCYACFKISTEVTRKFCKHCGNDTLQRVSMTVDDDGSIRYFLSTRKPLSTRGKKFNLPTPKGGKYAGNPILVEDQKEAQQRASKASRVKYDAMDPDYVTHTSPFAPHDTQSRAAQLGFNRWGKRNRGGGSGTKRGGRRK